MLRGYTIPLLDLANDTFRQYVVDREEGQYLGHPTTVLLDDGQTIITVYPKSHGKGPIALKKSYDGGKTWTERLRVPESWATSLEVPMLYRTTDAEGKRHIIMFSGMYPIRMAHSEDEGESWSELAPIGDFGGIVAMGDVTHVGKGEYLAFFHDDGRFIKPDSVNLCLCDGRGRGHLLPHSVFRVRRQGRLGAHKRVEFVPEGGERAGQYVGKALCHPGGL